MIGLIFLIVVGAYIALLIGATRWGYVWAERRGKSRRTAAAWAVAGFMVVFLPVFWDAIPTWIAFKYYSEKEAGLKVFKTLEQWKQENPKVAQTLEPYHFSRNDNRRDSFPLGAGWRRDPLNDRFAYDTNIERPFLSIKIWVFRLVDVKTGEVLARFKAITSGNSGGLASGGPGWWKFWLIHGDLLRSPEFLDWSRMREAAANMSGEHNVQKQ